MQNNKISGDIIGIAISGQTSAKLKVTYYFRNADEPTVIATLTPKTLLPMAEIVKMFKKEKFGDSVTDSDLHDILTKN
ncbi:MAG: hypothetical protein LUC34_05565 [Campylobacter sp.]|nr:hypothetical protein [Campylobacter sp.]